jgi:glycine cleavage system aminomethyltransferase T
VLEAGLGFAVRTQKPDFIGRDAVLRKREEGWNVAWSSSS